MNGKLEALAVAGYEAGSWVGWKRIEEVDHCAQEELYDMEEVKALVRAGKIKEADKLVYDAAINAGHDKDFAKVITDQIVGPLVERLKRNS